MAAKPMMNIPVEDFGQMAADLEHLRGMIDEFFDLTSSRRTDDHPYLYGAFAERQQNSREVKSDLDDSTSKHQTVRDLAYIRNRVVDCFELVSESPEGATSAADRRPMPSDAQLRTLYIFQAFRMRQARAAKALGMTREVFVARWGNVAAIPDEAKPPKKANGRPRKNPAAPPVRPKAAVPVGHAGPKGRSKKKTTKKKVMNPK